MIKGHDTSIPTSYAPAPAPDRFTIPPEAAAIRGKAADAEAGVFAIIATNVVLSDKTKQLGNPARQRGDVAMLDDGRLVARVAMECRDGSLAYASGPYDPKTPVEKAAYPGPIDPAGLVDVDAMGRDKFHPLEPDLEARELARFREQFPSITERLGLFNPVGPIRLFDTGPVFYERSSRSGRVLAADEVRDWVGKHASGDHGLLGEDTGEPVTQSQLWELDRMPVAVKNRAAIATGSGVIRSTFALDEAGKPTGPHRRYQAIEVVTVLGRRGPKTVVKFTSVESLNEPVL